MRNSELMTAMNKLAFDVHELSLKQALIFVHGVELWVVRYPCAVKREDVL